MDGLLRSRDRRVRILEAAPELAEGVSDDELMVAAAAVTASEQRLSRGVWFPEREGRDVALLVLDGLMVRSVDVEGSACAELIGPGDVVRPWGCDADATVLPAVGWEVLDEVRLAVLDHRALAAIGHWPALVDALTARAVRRAHALAFQLAVSGLTRADLRLLTVLWNLADRWGKVTPEGVALPLQLTHRVLGRLVAVRRPSVTTHLGHLRERGLVTQRRGRGWMLHGEPPAEVAEIRARLAPLLAGQA